MILEIMELDYLNCHCRKRLTDQLVEECSENINQNKMTNSTWNEYKNVCNSCTIFIVLLVIFFVISISTSSVFLFLLAFKKE